MEFGHACLEKLVHSTTLKRLGARAALLRALVSLATHMLPKLALWRKGELSFDNLCSEAAIEAARLLFQFGGSFAGVMLGGTIFAGGSPVGMMGGLFHWSCDSVEMCEQCFFCIALLL